MLALCWVTYHHLCCLCYKQQRQLWVTTQVQAIALQILYMMNRMEATTKKRKCSDKNNYSNYVQLGEGSCSQSFLLWNLLFVLFSYVFMISHSTKRCADLRICSFLNPQMTATQAAAEKASVYHTVHKGKCLDLNVLRFLICNMQQFRTDQVYT